MYFACVIGTSAQAADVTFNGASLRGIGLTHCVPAFFFNPTVLALTIDIAAGLFRLPALNEVRGRRPWLPVPGYRWRMTTGT